MTTETELQTLERRLAEREHQGRVRKGKRRVCAVQKTDAHEWFPAK